MQDENIGLNTQEYIEKGGKETKTGSRKSQEDAWRCNYKIKQEITQQKNPEPLKLYPSFYILTPELFCSLAFIWT